MRLVHVSPVRFRHKCTSKYLCVDKAFAATLTDDCSD